MKNKIIGAAVALTMLGASNAFAAVTSVNSLTALDISGYWSVTPGDPGNDESDPAHAEYTGSFGGVLTKTEPAIIAPAGYFGSISASLNDGLSSPTQSWLASSQASATAYSACLGVNCSDLYSSAVAYNTVIWTTTFTLDADDTFSLSYLLAPDSGSPGFSIDFYEVDEFGSPLVEDAAYSNVFDTAGGGLLVSNQSLNAGYYFLQVILANYVFTDDGSVVTSGGYGQVELTVGNPVPLPGAVWLLLSGVGGLGAMVRRRRQAAVAA